MPSESSSVVSNETNGIEPPRALLSVKKSKKGPLKQIVPQYKTLKNDYTLLWDMPGNEGYIKVIAAMQKFFDQAISGNWSYNPTQYENNEVPMSTIITDFLNTYKYGWKTSYYQNTYDFKSEDMTDLENDSLATKEQAVIINKQEIDKLSDQDGADCDACAI
jgi:ribonucleoside-diphosphate reductase alpha chain